MPEYKSELENHLNRAEERSSKFIRVLQMEGDMVSIILRSHLIIEELLFSFVESHCADKDQLRAARLRFPQLVALARSLERLPISEPDMWDAISKLNTARNALAHNLDPAHSNPKVEAYVRAAASSEMLEELGENLSSTEAVTRAASFILGKLEMLDAFSNALNLLIAKKLS